MSKAAASASHDLFDLNDFADADPDDDSLDLEAYLDLEESPEIARLMQEMRGQGAQAAAPAAPERPAGPAVSAPAAPAGRVAVTATGTVLRGAGRSAPAPEPEARPEPARPPARRAASRDASRLDLAAVARALGEVTVQARQLVVACPRCEGRTSIVIYADRFKCFGCEATGDERALAAHLTGWDPRRVVAWLEAAAETPEVDDADVRRPWRLSLFAR